MMISVIKGSIVLSNMGGGGLLLSTEYVPIVAESNEAALRDIFLFPSALSVRLPDL